MTAPLLAFLFSISVSHLAIAFTVITQNMAEISDGSPQRIDKLLSRLEKEEPDIIFLQEAEDMTLERIKSRPSLRPYRSFLLLHGRTPSGGLITLVKRSIHPSEGSYIRLPSEMARGFLLTTINVCGTPLTLINLHLESPDLIFWRNRGYRHQQVEILQSVVQEHGHAVIAGDFNFVFDRTAENMVPPNWTDTWKVLHPDEQGLTWDPETNERAYKAGLYILPGFRLDRAFLVSDEITLESVQMVGRNESESLSDHYGLKVKLGCNVR